jgi:hypothetical protein
MCAKVHTGFRPNTLGLGNQALKMRQSLFAQQLAASLCEGT